MNNNNSNSQSKAVDVDAAVSITNNTANNNKTPETLDRSDVEGKGSMRRSRENPQNLIGNSDGKSAEVKVPNNTAFRQHENQGPTSRHEKVLEIEVTTIDAKNYIRRFERLATFSELVYNSNNNNIALFPDENQRPTFVDFRSMLEKFLNQEELATLEATFIDQSKKPAKTPPPFPWSPLLLLLSQQYATMESVPDFVLAFIIQSYSYPDFEEFASFSRRVNAFLSQLSPVELLQDNAIGAAIRQRFRAWFHCSNSYESDYFLVFMNRNVETMIQKIGLGYKPPALPTSFVELATGASKNEINTQFAAIIHQGNSLSELTVVSEKITRENFVDRWREIAGETKIDIVSAQDSLDDGDGFIQAASNERKLVILSGPSGCGKSVAAFTLARTGVVAYIDARQVLSKGDLEGPPRIQNEPMTEMYLLRRDRNAVSLLVEVLCKCLYDGMSLPEREMKRFRNSHYPLTDAAIIELFKTVFGDWSNVQPSRTKFTMVLDEVGAFPDFVRACDSVGRFSDYVKNFFKIEGSVHLVAVGANVENLDLNDSVGSLPPSFIVLRIKPKNLLFHLLRSRAISNACPKATFFAKLFHFLFPNHFFNPNYPARYVAVVCDAAGYRFVQLASNARCAVLLIKFFDLLFEGWIKEDNNNDDNNNQNNAKIAEIKDVQFLWRLRAALPVILQQVATTFVSLNGLAIVQGDQAKYQEIAFALGYSLNRVSNLTTEEWNRSAKTNGLTSDSARWTPTSYQIVKVCDPNTNLPIKSGRNEYFCYCFPEKTPRYRIAEASVAVLMQHLGIADAEKGFATNAGWELLEQVTFDFHCIRSIIPSTPEIDQKFNARFSEQQFVETQCFPLTTKEQGDLKTAAAAATRQAVISRPIWADPHVLFSIKSSQQVRGIYPIHLKTALQKSNVAKFADMTHDAQLSTRNGLPERVTWKRAIENRYAIILLNAPRAANADVICLTPDRVFMTQCKRLTATNMSTSGILEEFRKMREPDVLSLLRHCCMVKSKKEDEVEVVCTLVLRREDSVNLWRNEGALWYETDDLSKTNIREFFVAEKKNDHSEVSSSFYPFMQTRDATIGIQDVADHSVRLSNLRQLWNC